MSLRGLHAGAAVAAADVAAAVAAELRGAVPGAIDTVVCAASKDTVLVRASDTAWLAALDVMPRAKAGVVAPPAVPPHVPYAAPTGDKNLRRDPAYLNYLRLGRALTEAARALVPLVGAVARRYHAGTLLPAVAADAALGGVASLQCPQHTGKHGWAAVETSGCVYCTPWLDLLKRDHVAGDASMLHIDNTSPCLWAHDVLGPWAVLKM